MKTVPLTEKMKYVMELTRHEGEIRGLAQGIAQGLEEVILTSIYEGVRIGEKRGRVENQELLRRRLASSQADAIPEDVKEWLLSPEKEDMN